MSLKRSSDRSLDSECKVKEDEKTSAKRRKIKSTSKTEKDKEFKTTTPSDTDKNVSSIRDVENRSEARTDNEEKRSIIYKQLKTGRNKLTSYAYITDIDDFVLAMKNIRHVIDSKKMIAVDCEGVELSRFGSLTILSIGTEEVVFLIDVLKIGSAVFDKGLRNILEDAAIEKLMFDCREDADALFHNHSVILDGVLDIQLLDVKDRIRSNGYTKIRSLKHCLQLYTMDDTTLLNIKVSGRSNMDDKGEVWGRRPLNEKLLEYAVVDVVALFTLYNTLKMRVQHQRWKEASNRYCGYDRNRRRVCRDGSNRLPSGII